MTKVETFEMTEVVENQAEPPDAEAIALIEKLGLAGQKSLIGGEEKKSRLPYRPMTVAEHFVYSTILSDRSKLEEYNSESIPLRVLQIAAHAKEINLFKRLEVWGTPQATETIDPVLVGVKEVNSYTEAFYILARWGEELETMTRLHSKALALWKNKMERELNKAISDAKRDLDFVKNVSGPFIPEKKGITFYGLE